MNWRVRSGPALFRDVSFNIESVDVGGGRKTVVHEYPLRDTPFVEDLGRRGQSLSVQGYVVGDDYIEQRDKLLAVLQQPGPGRLLLPYHGFVTVMVSSFGAGETRPEGGIAYVSMEFLETEESPIFPTQVKSLTSAVDSAVGGALDSLDASLVENLVVAGAPPFTLDSLSSVVSSGGISLLAALSPVTSAIGSVIDTVGAGVVAVASAVEQAATFAAEIKGQIDDLVLSADALVRSPFMLAARLRDVVESVFESPSLPARNVDALLKAYEFTSDTPSPAPVTANRVREARNYAAIESHIKTMNVVAAARFAPRAAFESYEQAVTTRARITDLLDAQAETASDAVYPALMDLRAALVRAVPGEDSDLPRITKFTPPTTLPSLVLAHRLYGSVDRELEIVARNRVRHPGFVLGGREIEALRDA